MNQNLIRIRKYQDKKRILDEFPTDYERPLMDYREFEEWRNRFHGQKPKKRFSLVFLLP